MTTTKEYPTSPNSATPYKYVDSPPLWERLAVRALIAAYQGKDYRRHIHRAAVAARLDAGLPIGNHRRRRRTRHARGKGAGQ